MNLKQLHTPGQAVEGKSVFTAGETRVNSLQILAGQLLKEHVSNVPALLVCISGEAHYEDEHGVSEVLRPADYVTIEPMVKHWVKGLADSNLLLVK